MNIEQIKNVAKIEEDNKMQQRKNSIENVLNKWGVQYSEQDFHADGHLVVGKRLYRYYCHDILMGSHPDDFISNAEELALRIQEPFSAWKSFWTGSSNEMY